MESCAWMNVQHRQVGPPSQSSQTAAQFTHNTRNQQAGTANISRQYGTENTGVRPPPNVNLFYRDGGYANRQPSNQQTSAVPRQAVRAQQITKANPYLRSLLKSNLPCSSANTQSGHPGLPVTCPVQQVFHQNPTQSPSNVVAVNTTYPQQNMPANWNQMVRAQSMSTQNSNVVSDLQYYRDTNSLPHNLNVSGTQLVSACRTTATSLPREKETYTGTLVPAAPHNGQTAHNNNPRINVPQFGSSPPNYNTAMSLRNDCMTTKSSSSGQNLLVSNTSLKNQQYMTTHNRGNGTSYTDLLCSYGRQCVDPREDTWQAIARIEDYLHNPSTAGTGGCPPVHNNSPHVQQQFGSEVRMMPAQQNMQPVTMNVTNTYNLNASHSLPLNSGQYLPKTTHSVMSTQQSIDVPSVFHPTASQDGSHARDPKIVGSSSDTFQRMQLMLEGVSPQRKEIQSSVANNRERLEALSSAVANDSSIHLSPGRTRAVAVVQPLSQESYQVASKKTSPNIIRKSPEGTATDVSWSNPEKLFISPNNKQDGPGVGPNPNLENPNQIFKHSAASNHSAIVSSSDSAGPQDLPQKQLCAADTGSEPAIDMQVDQCAAPTAQQSITSKVPVSESGEKDESDMLTDPKEVLDLSSVPTTPWTLAMLNKLVENGEKAQKVSSDYASPLRKLMPMFWGWDLKNMIKELKAFRYNNIADTRKFGTQHEDAVILSLCLEKQLERYHVLRDNEVYSERPYKSSWLNINEQLDDIDKDFGFPWSLKGHLHMLESDSQSDQFETDYNVSVQIANEVSKKMSSTELEPVDSSEEKQDFTIEDILTQTASPDKVESADICDPYSLEIQVLPPEEAKVIFEQVQSELQQSMDTDNQPERDTNSPTEGELFSILDAPLSDRNLENEPVSPIEEVCCVERLKEMIWGSDTASLSKCQCKYNQSQTDVSEKTLVEEEVAVNKEDEMYVIRSDSKFHSATEGENEAKGNQVMTFVWPELCNELSHTTDFIHLSSFESEIPNQIPDSENECRQSNSSDERETKKISRSATELQSDPRVYNVQDQLKLLMSDHHHKEHLEAAHLISTNEEESLLGNEEETKISVSGAQQTSLSGKHGKRKKKRRRKHDGSFPVFKKSKKSHVDADSQSVLEGASKCGKGVLDATDGEPSASNVRTVELALFGSTPQDRRILTGGRKSHISSPNAVGCAVSKAPEVLTVNLSPKRKSWKTMSTWEYSLKQLYKKWRIHSPPPKIRHRSKLKAQKCTSYGGHLKKAGTMRRPASNEALPVSSKMRVWNANTKTSFTLKRMWSVSNGLKRGKDKMDKYTVTLNQPADQERNEAESGSHDVMPHQDSIILKFSVLPNSFSFKDGSNAKETKDPVPDTPERVEGKSHNKTAKKARGTWDPLPEKKCFSPPKTDSIFHEFQRKYKEKMLTTDMNE